MRVPGVPLKRTTTTTISYSARRRRGMAKKKRRSGDVADSQRHQQKRRGRGRPQATVLDLPHEVLLGVFQYACPTYRELGLVLRPVCTRFHRVASAALNSAFLRLGARLEAVLAGVAALLEAGAPGSLELQSTANLFRVLENLRNEHRVMEAVMGDVLDAADGRCMFHGMLLDRMLGLVRDAVRILGGGDPYIQAHTYFAVEVAEFLDCFDRLVDTGTAAALAGKVLGLLDAAVDLQRRVERAVRHGDDGPPRLHLRVVYTMPGAFVVEQPLPVAADAADGGAEHSAAAAQQQPGAEVGPRERRRHVFLRLRLLLQLHNEVALQKLQADRSSALLLPNGNWPHYGWAVLGHRRASLDKSRFAHYAVLHPCSFDDQQGSSWAPPAQDTGAEDRQRARLGDWLPPGESDRYLCISNRVLDMRRYAFNSPGGQLRIQVDVHCALEDAPTLSRLPCEGETESSWPCEGEAESSWPCQGEAESSRPCGSAVESSGPCAAAALPDSDPDDWDEAPGAVAARLGAAAGTRSRTRLRAAARAHCRVRVGFHSALAAAEGLPSKSYLYCDSSS